MNNIEDLFIASEGLLKNHGFDNTNFQRPYWPASVFYYGKRSRMHHEALLEDLSDGWGRDNAKSVKFYCIEDTVDHTITDVLEDKTVTADEIMIQYQSLMEKERLFADPSTVNIYFIFDSSFVENDEQFESWYKEFEYLKNILFRNVPMRSMLIIILDESFQKMDIAHTFRLKLLELYKSAACGKDNSHIYDSVFLLSSKRNVMGYECFDPSSPKYENNNILGELILLSNTREADLSVRNTELYSSGIIARTAAHDYIEKPNSEIIYVALSVVFDKMKDMLNLDSNKTLSNEELLLALGINNHKSDIVENIYGELKEQLPKQDFIEELPNYDSSNNSYAELDRKTLGCLSGFIKLNHFEIVEQKITEGKPEYVKEFLKTIRDHLNANKLSDEHIVESSMLNSKDAYKALTKEAFDVLDKVYFRAETNNVAEVIKYKTMSKIAEQLVPIVNEALTNAIQESIATMDAFNSLYDAFKNYVAYSVDDEQRESIEQFYKHRIGLYFNDKDRKQVLFNKLMMTGNSSDDMLQILLEELRSIFSYDPIFKKSFYDELVLRLESSAEIAQDVIIRALVRNINNKILLKSETHFEKKMEVIFINRDHESNTSLIEEINRMPTDDGVIRSIFNTSDDDYAESLWVFDCSEQNLIM